MVANTDIQHLEVVSRLSGLAKQAVELTAKESRDNASINRLICILQLFKDNRLTCANLAQVLQAEVRNYGYRLDPPNDEVVHQPEALEVLLRGVTVFLRDTNQNLLAHTAHYVRIQLRQGVAGIAKALESDPLFSSEERISERFGHGRLSKL